VGSRDRRHIPTSGATTIGGSSRRCSQPTLCASELGYHEPVGLRKHGGGAALGSAGVWIGCTYEDVMGMGMGVRARCGTSSRWKDSQVRCVFRSSLINPRLTHSSPSLTQHLRSRVADANLARHRAAALSTSEPRDVVSLVCNTRKLCTSSVLPYPPHYLNPVEAPCALS
jgi:hypothetical protein